MALGVDLVPDSALEVLIDLNPDLKPGLVPDVDCRRWGMGHGCCHGLPVWVLI